MDARRARQGAVKPTVRRKKRLTCRYCKRAFWDVARAIEHRSECNEATPADEIGKRKDIPR
jgi:hypothetical protein